ERAAARAVVVLGLRDGSLQHRINLDEVDAVQFAARRMLALVLAARRRLVAIDLRFGRVLIDQLAERDVAALAIDDTGQDLALRYDEPYGELFWIAVDELAALPQPPEGGASRAVVQIAAPATPAESPDAPAPDPPVP